MPNIVYLYTSGGAPRCDMSVTPPWDMRRLTRNRFALAAQSDGMINMFKILSDRGHIGTFTAVIDSTISPGHIQLGHSSFLYVVPSMSWADQFITTNDILVVRGGFKPWIPFLDYIWKRRENWILFYRANTNRHAWPFWDITLNDLIDRPKSIRGRLHYNFSKPVNEDIFNITNTGNRNYDVMIGASHIHRKKGQHKTVRALQEYYHMYGEKPKAILPGGYMKSATNRIIMDIINSGDVDIEGPVPMTRPQLASAMNNTKLFVHAGYGGQNDRGILEAMSCGCQPVLFGKSHVSPIIWHYSRHITQEPTDIASTVRAALHDTPLYSQSACAAINSLDTVAVPKMLKLFKFLERRPVPDRRAACERFVK